MRRQLSGITINNVEEDDLSLNSAKSTSSNRMLKFVIEGKDYLSKEGVLLAERPKDFNKGARPIDSIDIR